MKIKKIIVGLFTVICLICAFAFAACGNNTGKDDPKATYYTVTFYTNIYGEDVDIIQKSVESGRTAADKVPTNMVNGGYIFVGWYTDEGLTQDFDIENTPITSDISLYARWKKKNVYDRAWFLGELEKCAANASTDKVERTSVSYKARIDGASAQNFTSTIENGCITVGSYNVRLIVTAEWFESNILNGTGITVTAENYYVSSNSDIAAIIHFTNGQNQNRIISIHVDKYGYVSGCSEKIDNGSGEATTTLYLLSSINYE